MTLQFLHRPYMPQTYPGAAPERAPEVLATWLRYCPDSQPTDRDWEDWSENAIMLHQANRVSNGNVRIVGTTMRGHTLGDNSPMVKPRPGAAPAFMYGLFTSADTMQFPEDVNLVANNADSVRKIQAYASSPTFLAAAGRRFFVCDVTEESLDAALLELHSAGERRAFVKTRFKEAAQILNLRERKDRLWVAAAMDTDFEWYLVSHEGMNGILFVQEVFQPTKEYRTIILGDEVVTGAGCIEHFTPFDSRAEAFDPRVETLRNRSEVIEDHKTVERYREFASRYAAAWAAENGPEHAYSLDLAVDARNGNVVAIEMNPLMNLGLYATDAVRLMDGICSRFG